MSTQWVWPVVAACAVDHIRAGCCTAIVAEEHWVKFL